MEKFDCSVFNAATAAYARQLHSECVSWRAYRIVTLLHGGGAVVEQASRDSQHGGILLLA